MSNYLQLRRYSSIHFKNASGIESRRHMSCLAKFLVFLDNKQLSFESIVQDSEIFQNTLTEFVATLKEQNRTGRYIHDALGAIQIYAEFVQAGEHDGTKTVVPSGKQHILFSPATKALEDRVLCKLLLLAGLDGNQCRHLRVADIKTNKIVLHKRGVEMAFAVPADLMSDLAEILQNRQSETADTNALLFTGKGGKPMTAAALAYRLRTLSSAVGTRLTPSILKRTYRVQSNNQADQLAV